MEIRSLRAATEFTPSEVEGGALVETTGCVRPFLSNPSDGLFSACRPFRKDEAAMAREWPKAEMDREIDRALARGRRRAISEPRATRARYDRRTGRVVVDLTNGCSFVFPARSLQGLAQARDAELADIEILGSGHGLHWPALDADFTVPGLLMGVVGTRAWMASELARRAGQAKSPAKAAAARTNGRKGGRPPRKVA